MAQKNLTNLHISQSFQRLLQLNPDDNITVLDGTGSYVSLNISGALSASVFYGDGGGITNISASALPPGLLSGSAQIAIEISGAFTDLSESLSTRIELLESSSGIIGPAEDGDYTDGLWTDFVPGTLIGTPIDRFNELFKSLVPPPAPDLSDWSVVNPVGDVIGKLSFDSLNDIAASPGYVGADTAPFSPVSVDGAWTISGKRLGIIAPGVTSLTGTLNDQVSTGPGTPTPAYGADSFNKGTTGTLKLYINGVLANTADLTSTDSAIDSRVSGTGFNLSAKQFGKFPLGDDFTFSVYRTGTWHVDATDVNIVKGYNYIIAEHDLGATQLTLTRFEFVIDDDATPTAYSGYVFDNLIMAGSKYLSGVEYYTAGTAEYDIDIDNAYRNTYDPSAVAVSFIGTNCTATAQPLGSNGGNELLQVNVVNKLVTINNNIRLLHPSGTGNITIQTQVLRTLQGTTTSDTRLISDILLDSRTSTATQGTSEDFVGEQYRLINVNGALDYDLIADVAANPWDSTEVLKDAGTAGYNDGLQVYNDKLVYPSLDFSYPNSPSGSSNPNAGDSTRDYTTGISGNRTYTRYFRQVSPTTANFIMNIGGSGGTFVSTATGLTGNNIHVEIKGPTQTGWMDAYQDFATGFFGDGDGARNATSGPGRAFNTNWGITIGTKSTANTGGYIVVRITVGSSFTGEFTGINWTFS